MGLITRKDLTNLEYRLPSDHDLADHEAGETTSLLGSMSSFGDHSMLSLANSQSFKDMLIAHGMSLAVGVLQHNNGSRVERCGHGTGDVTGIRALGSRAINSASMAPTYQRRASHDTRPSPLNPIYSAPAMEQGDDNDDLVQ